VWDLFCRVIDNHGDAGVCWRLAAALAARGQAVRLVIDDAAPLSWMAPGGTPGVSVLPWPGPAEAGDVVIEAFGCDPPDAFVQAMARRAVPPVWINLEYLSAEDWVERAHGLPSPHASGLRKWFLFPGFTPQTLGLICEPGLPEARAAFDGRAWLSARGWAPAEDERSVLLFAYHLPHAPGAAAAWLAGLAARPTRLLVPPGPLQSALQGLALPAGLRLTALPFVPQTEFDCLLWSADLAFVRGEDSLVRALWSGTPFVWQAYPQHDGVHHGKVEAMLHQLALPPAVAACWRSWNSAPDAELATLPADTSTWRPAFAATRQRLQAGPELVQGLLRFVQQNGAGTGVSPS
jgi:uncharacterized repeat protein (TIGR03837 family)